MLLPIATMSVPVGTLSQAAVSIVNNPSIVSLQKSNIDPVRSRSPQGERSTLILERAASNGIEAFSALALNQAVDLEAVAEEAREAKALAIDTYFKARHMPLAGMGMKMVEEAEKYNLDWRLLPAIAVRESTGGKYACKKATYSTFGWGSCKINFDSHGEAIETVARNLGGYNPNTAKHYKDKTTEEILRAYNPPSIIPRYVQQVTAIMNSIGEKNPSPTLVINTEIS